MTDAQYYRIVQLATWYAANGELGTWQTLNRAVETATYGPAGKRHGYVNTKSKWTLTYAGE